MGHCTHTHTHTQRQNMNICTQFQQKWFTSSFISLELGLIVSATRCHPSPEIKNKNREKSTCVFVIRIQFKKIHVCNILLSLAKPYEDGLPRPLPPPCSLMQKCRSWRTEVKTAWGCHDEQSWAKQWRMDTGMQFLGRRFVEWLPY